MQSCATKCLILAVLLMVGLGCAPTVAQEVMLGGGMARSDFTELGAPVTAAFHARFPLPIRELDPVMLGVVAGGRWGQEAGEEMGITCVDYWPQNAGCVEEPIAWDAQIFQLELGLGAGLALGPIEVRAILLGAQTLLVAGAEGVETGRSPGRYYPDSTHRGLAAAGEVVWRGVVLEGLGVVVRGRRQTLDFRGCVTDAATPYCGEEPMTTFELGLSYRLAP